MLIWKRILFITSCLVLLILSTLASIAFFIDVDRYRPDIIRLINERINGQAEIGQLSLNLWGKIEIEINGLKVQYPDGQTALQMDQASIYFPFSNFFRGQPHLMVSLNEPQVFVEKSTDGEWNILQLLLDSDDETVVSEEQKRRPIPGENRALAIFLASTIDFEMREARLHYHDLETDLTQQFESLNLLLENIALNKPVQMQFWADLDTQLPTISLKGPMRIDGILAPQFSGSRFELLDYQLQANFDGLMIHIDKLFHKTHQQNFEITSHGRLTKQKLQLDSFITRLIGMELKTKGSVQYQPELAYQLAFYTPSFDLKDWQQTLLPLNNRLSDSISLSFDGVLETNHLKSFQLDLLGPGTDLKITASAQDISAPLINIEMRSKNIDLNRIFNLTEKAPKVVSEERPNPDQSSAVETDSSSPIEMITAGDEDSFSLDESLAKLKELAVFQNMRASLQMDMQQILYEELAIHDINLTGQYAKLIADLENFSFGIFSGKAILGGKLDLRQEKSNYNFTLSLDKIEVAEAVKSQLQAFSRTILGRLYLDGKGQGQSLDSDQILANLQMEGKFRMEDATFASIDVVEMVNQGAIQAIESVRNRYPLLAHLNVGQLTSSASQFKLMHSDFTMTNGVIKAPNFQAEPASNQGVYIKGYTEMDLIHDRLQALWHIVDIYDASGLKGVDLSVKGIKIESILADRDEPVSIPLELGCQISKPCFHYETLARHFVAIANRRMEQEARGRLQNEVEQRLSTEKERLKKRLEEQARGLLRNRGE